MLHWRRGKSANDIFSFESMTILHIMGVILMILALVAILSRDEVDRDRGGSRTSELFLTLLRMKRNERNVIGITEGEV